MAPCNSLKLESTVLFMCNTLKSQLNNKRSEFNSSFVINLN